MSVLARKFGAFVKVIRCDLVRPDSRPALKRLNYQFITIPSEGYNTKVKNAKIYIYALLYKINCQYSRPITIACKKDKCDDFSLTVR